MWKATDGDQHDRWCAGFAESARVTSTYESIREKVDEHTLTAGAKEADYGDLDHFLTVNCRE